MNSLAGGSVLLLKLMGDERTRTILPSEPGRPNGKFHGEMLRR